MQLQYGALYIIPCALKCFPILFERLKAPAFLLLSGRPVIGSDDVIVQAVQGEEANMVVVPRWDSDGDDGILKALTDALLHFMGALKPEDDVRRFTKAVQEAAARPVAEAAAAAKEAAAAAAAAAGKMGMSGAGNAEEIALDFEDEDDAVEEEDQEHAGAEEPADQAQLVAA